MCKKSHYYTYLCDYNHIFIICEMKGNHKRNYNGKYDIVDLVSYL